MNTSAVVRGRIVIVNGHRFHVGGRLVPTAPHILKFHSSQLGLNLGALPPTPAATHYSDAPAAQPALRDIMGNDQYGCCTEADQFHQLAMRQAMGDVGIVYRAALSDVLMVYGRDGGMPGDNGCDEITVLTNGCKLGIPCGRGMVDRASGYLCVDATNRDMIRAAVSMFGPGSICIGLPDPWVAQMPSSDGYVWKRVGASNPNNGHCFTLGDQDDSDTALIWSWARKGRITYDALATYATDAGGGGLYFRLDQDIIDAARLIAPDGMDWDAVKAAFRVMGGVEVAPVTAVQEETFWQKVLDEVRNWM